MLARFNENPDIKETKRYGRTDNVKTVYPLQTKFAGGIIKLYFSKDQGCPTFLGGGGGGGGGGGQSISIQITCDFPGGGFGPPIPLWILA